MTDKIHPKGKISIPLDKEPEIGCQSGVGPHEENKMTAAEDIKSEAARQRLEEAFRAAEKRMNERRKLMGFPPLKESIASDEEEDKRFEAVLERVLETGKLERFDF